MSSGGVLPVFFRKSPELTGNYDFIDLATGRGRKSLYMIGTQVSGATSYILDTISYESNGFIGDVGTGMSKIMDLDFDMLLKKPLKIEGQAICTFGVGIFGWPTIGVRSLYMVCRIRKVIGSTETEIATNTTDKFIDATIGDYDVLFTLPVTIPETTFNPGESLRCTIEIWGMTSNGNTDSGVRWAGTATTAVLWSELLGNPGNFNALALLQNAGSQAGKLIIPIVLDT